MAKKEENIKITVGKPSASPPDHQTVKGQGGNVNPQGLNKYNVGDTAPDQNEVEVKPSAVSKEEGVSKTLPSGTVRNDGQSPLLQELDNDNAQYFHFGTKPKKEVKNVNGNRAGGTVRTDY